jgi:hypothetical protein
MKTAMTDASSYARLDTVHPSDDGWAADIVDGGLPRTGGLRRGEILPSTVASPPDTEILPVSAVKTVWAKGPAEEVPRATAAKRSGPAGQ